MSFDAAHEVKEAALEVAEVLTTDTPLEGWKSLGYYDGDTEFRFERADGMTIQVLVNLVRRPNNS